MPKLFLRSLFTFGLLAMATLLVAQKKVVLTADPITVAAGDTCSLVIRINYDTTDTIKGWNFSLYLPEGLTFATEKPKKSCSVSTETHDAEYANECLTFFKKDGCDPLFTWIDRDDGTALTSTHGTLMTIRLKATTDVVGDGLIYAIALTNSKYESVEVKKIADATIRVNDCPPVPPEGSTPER